MSGSSNLSNLIANLVTQVRAAIDVGVPVDDTVDGSRRTAERETTIDLSEEHRWDDPLGRMTRNGLGSLEIGAGKSRIDE